MKVCYKCKQEKLLTEFRRYKSGVNKGYYHSYCKVCVVQDKKTQKSKEAKNKYMQE